MDKDKIIVSVVIDKQALVDRAFDISKNLSEFNEIEKVIDGKNQFTRDIDEIDDERTTQTIIGSIQLSRQFSGFHINDGQLWKPVQLGDFFRLNRSFFETKEKNMELVNLLKSFSAKVQTTIKKEYSDNGSVTDNYEKAVDSNLPPSFTINIPIFKGAEPEKLSIETIAHVEGNMALLTLISADAECIIEESRDKIINTELDKIRKLCPEIPIMEV